jgi:flagellar basal-body rod protein FlgC
MSFEDMLTQMRGGIIHTGIAFNPNGVMMAGVVEDPTPGKKVYNPKHPEADKDGYITTANVSPLTELADATATSRVYEANLAVMGIVKQMANRALEIGRGQ